MGERKNQKVNTWPRIWGMSRYRTLAAATIRVKPKVKANWQTMMSGRRHAVSPTLIRYSKRKANRMGIPKRKFTKLAVTVTVGKTWAGKKTFFKRLPPSTMDVAPISREVENQIQGKSPHRRKAAYRSVAERI